jgi:hypothetical protein
VGWREVTGVAAAVAAVLLSNPVLPLSTMALPVILLGMVAPSLSFLSQRYQLEALASRDI